MKKSLLILTVMSILSGYPIYADTPAIHGMLLFGNKTTYASHLPMFHAPHDYQAILKLSLQDLPGSKTISLYKQVKDQGKTLFTLVPEVMDLSKVLDGTKIHFHAEIYDGHFEKGGESLGEVNVGVEKVVYGKKLIDIPQQPGGTESYLLFGGVGEYFAAHLIESKPSFDSVAKLSQPYTLKAPFCKTRYCPEPEQTPISDTQLPVKVLGSQHPHSGESLGDPQSGAADIIDVIYSEDKDLS